MTKKISLSLLAIIISGCVLISAGLIVGGWFLLKAQKNYVAPTVEVTPPPSIDEQMDQIQEEVAGIRGLELKTSLDRALMTTSELEDVVINDLFKEYTAEDAQKDVELLSVIGLLDADFDLIQFYKDLYSEQIAGYYDSEIKEMKVIADGGFGGLERMTYAHEFTHVLQDQNFDLENGLMLNEDYCETESEYCAAVTALVEGDATLAEQYWFIRNSTDQDKADVMELQANFEMPVYDSAPEFMKQDFLFPYEKGLAFVNWIYRDDKWKSIDAVYMNPPVSTEQILHPEKYPDDQPVMVGLPDFASILGEDWTEIDRNVMGEWYSYLILSAGIDPSNRLDQADSETATRGWGGDAYVYFENANASEYVFVWLSIWDTPTDANEFYQQSRAYGKRRWGLSSVENEKLVSWLNEGYDQVMMIKDNTIVLWIITSEFAPFGDISNEFEYLVR